MLRTLEEYHDKGLLFKQTHPTLDLTIWNYTPKVQYERLWDDITIQCRGLVTNSEGKIIARPFKKFFNYEEHKSEEIPNEPYSVYEKMDGSLGILFHYNGQWIMSTRGSFTSPQSIKGTELLIKYRLSELFKSHTYLFEIIYPENRIVVDYNGEEKLVLIGAIETETGIEDDISIYFHYGFDVVTMYEISNKTYDSIKGHIPNDKEGYVIAFKNGFRMKIKGDEYIRLHQILTETSSRDIWECLKNNKSLDEILDEVPDEFYSWVKDTVSDLQTQFDSIKLEVENDFKELINKKEYAEKIKDNPNKSFLFKRLDSYSNQMNDMIWDSIYPPYIKPFKNEQ
jgi:hypothetical protein